MASNALPKAVQPLPNALVQAEKIVCFWQRSFSVTQGKIFAGELSY
ncbi:MAG: hypothetical protein QM569_11755 [Acidovorax sp.]